MMPMAELVWIWSDNIKFWREASGAWNYDVETYDTEKEKLDDLKKLYYG